MKKILVPIDGSDCSGVAIAKAQELAACLNARLVLINVYDMPTMRAYFDFGHDKREANVMEDLRRRSERVLNDGLAIVADMGGEQAEAISLEGDPADRIVEYACDDANDIDMIIMGSHGMGSMRRVFLGSVAHKVVVQANRPVMVI